MKPLPAIREQLFLNDLTIVSNINHQNNKPIFEEKKIYRNFFAMPEAEKMELAKEYLENKNKALKEKK